MLINIALDHRPADSCQLRWSLAQGVGLGALQRLQRLQPTQSKSDEMPNNTCQLLQVQQAEGFEHFWGRRAAASLCVTQAMQQELSLRWSIQATVFHDHAPSHFRRSTLQVGLHRNLHTGELGNS